MAGLLDWLLNSSGNSGNPFGTSGLLGGPGAAMTTPTLPPAQPDAGSPFAYRQGWMGNFQNSPMADMLRGGLAGLSTTGYSGWGALGAGAQEGFQADQRHQQNQIGNMLAGQQFKAGQQQLVGGNLNNIFALQRVNAMRAHFHQPPVTLNDLNANPDLVNNPTGNTQPQGSAAPQSGLNPVAQGGQAESTWVNGSGAEPSPAPAAAQPPAQSNDPYAGMQNAIDEQWGMDPSKAPGLEFQLAQLQQAPDQSAAVKRATDTAGFTSPSGIYSNVKDLASAFQSQPEVKTMGDVKPNFEATVAAYNAYKPGMPLGQQLPNDYNFASGVLKMINPAAANTRPNSVSAVEEAKGYQAVWQKVVQELNGGTGLSAPVRESLMQIARQRMQGYQSAYDAQVAGYRKRASMLPGVTEDMWNSTTGNPGAQSGPVQIKTDADYAALPSGTKFTGPDGKLRIKP